ncbi:MAG: thioredoxin family protein [Pirellulales bacterium]|nr:thioredoxin family protein [Pirellulales bacterium]
MRRVLLSLLILPVLLIGLAAAVSPVWAQAFDPLGGGQAGAPFGDEQKVLAVTAQYAAATADRPAGLFITAEIEPGWHIYSITQPAGGPVRTTIELDDSDEFRLAGQFRALSPPEKKREEVFDNLIVESHYGTVTWYAPLELSFGVDPSSLRITGKLTAQPCDANGCLMPQSFPFVAVLGQGLEIPDEFSTTTPPDAAAPPGDGSTGQGAAALDPSALVIAENEEIQKKPFALVLCLGFLGGLILNLMPCVLPVIGLKVLSFVEQAGQSRQRALVLNVWYSLGLLSVFVLLASLAVFLGYGWGQLFSFKGFNITLAAVVFVMGLSFLGVWEIPIPGFVGSGKALEAAEREGVAGAFLKGILTTILATPCGAPFLAPALTWAVAQPPLQTYAVFLCMGLGMASPYLLIGAFPALLRFLPKPGMWMETFKQLMGFVLMGTVVFLLTFVPWSYIVPTVGMLFGLWASCWWIGRTPPTAEAGRKTRAWLEAIAFAGVVWLFCFPGLDKVIRSRYAFGLHGVMQHRLAREIEQGIANRLAGLDVLASEADADLGPDGGPASSGLPWQPFTRKALDDLIAARQTVLVDFTADWCLTCKTLETAVLNTPEVREAVRANGVVALQADWTHGQPEVSQMLELLGSKQVPVIAVFPAGRPNEPIVFRGGYVRQQLLDALKEAGPSKPAS